MPDNEPAPILDIRKRQRAKRDQLQENLDHQVEISRASQIGFRAFLAMGEYKHAELLAQLYEQPLQPDPDDPHPGSYMINLAQAPDSVQHAAGLALLHFVAQAIDGRSTAIQVRVGEPVPEYPDERVIYLGMTGEQPKQSEGEPSQPGSILQRALGIIGQREQDLFLEAKDTRPVVPFDPTQNTRPLLSFVVRDWPERDNQKVNTTISSVMFTHVKNPPLTPNKPPTPITPLRPSSGAK